MTPTVYDLLEWCLPTEGAQVRNCVGDARTLDNGMQTGRAAQDRHIDHPTKTAPMVGLDAEDDTTLTQDRSRELEARWSRP